MTDIPITIWYVPAARAGTTLSFVLAQRLVAAYARGRRPIGDLTAGGELARIARAGRRRYVRHTLVTLQQDHRRAALIVAGWPMPAATPGTLMAGCAARLAEGCHLVVALGTIDPDVDEALITAAAQAGLVCTRRVVAAYRPGHPLSGTVPGSIHTDVLVFARRTPAP